MAGEADASALEGDRGGKDHTVRQFDEVRKTETRTEVRAGPNLHRAPANGPLHEAVVMLISAAAILRNPVSPGPSCSAVRVIHLDIDMRCSVPISASWCV